MNTPFFQMHKQQASSVSRLGASSHNNITSSKGNRSITTNTTKVLNKINALVRPPGHFLKPRPPPKIAKTAGEAAERFQIVHTPDRALGTIPLWEIPKTEAEYRAAILNMKMHGQLVQPGGGRAQQTDVEVRAVSGAYDHFPPRPGYVNEPTGAQPTTRRTKERSADRNTGRTLADPYTDRGSLAPRTGQYSEAVVPHTMPRVYYPSSPDLMRDHGGLLTPPASAPLSARIPPRAGKRRVASAEVPRPPRPLSERAMIPMGARARRREHPVTGFTISSSASTLVGSPAVTPIHSAAQSTKDGRTAVDLDNKARRRSIQGRRSTDYIAGHGRGWTAGDSGHARPGNPSPRRMRPKQETDDTQDARGAMPGITHCYVCQQPCEPGAGLCSECKDRAQPLGEVFEYSESEYGDDQACIPHPPPPGESPTPSARPPAPARRSGGTAAPDAEAADAMFRGWSGSLSPATAQWQHLRPQQGQGEGEGEGRAPSSMSRSRSESVSPTPHLALQLKVVPHQSIRKVSVTSPARNGPPSGQEEEEEEEDRRSALYHVQRPREPATSPGCASGQGREGAFWGSGDVRAVGEDGGDGAGDEYDQVYSIYDAYWNQKGDEGADGMI